MRVERYLLGMASVAACEPPKRGRESTIDYQAALALKAKGFTYDQIAKELGCKANTLRIQFTRKGYTKHVALATKGIQGQAVVSESKPMKDGSKLKAELAEELEEQLMALRSLPVRAAQLGNTPEGQGRAAIVKTIAETGKIAHGWGNDSVTIQFGVSMLADQDVGRPAIDVSAERVEIPAQTTPENSSPTTEENK